MTERDMYAIDIATIITDRCVETGTLTEDMAQLVFDSLVDGLRLRNEQELLYILTNDFNNRRSSNGQG